MPAFRTSSSSNPTDIIGDCKISATCSSRHIHTRHCGLLGGLGSFLNGLLLAHLLLHFFPFPEFIKVSTPTPTGTICKGIISAPRPHGPTSASKRRAMCSREASLQPQQYAAWYTRYYFRIRIVSVSSLANCSESKQPTASHVAVVLISMKPRLVLSSNIRTGKAPTTQTTPSAWCPFSSQTGERERVTRSDSWRA